MDDVDELDLDDDFFSSAQPMADISWNLNATTKTSYTSGHRVQQQAPVAASNASDASHRVPLKPLATLLRTPDFPRSARGFTPPVQPPCGAAADTADRAGTVPTCSTSGALRVTKRPAEGDSLLSSKRVVVHHGQHIAASLRSQPTSSTPTSSSQPGLLAQSGFRHPPAPKHRGLQHDRHWPAQVQSRAPTPTIQQERPSSSAVSRELRAVSGISMIPGPAGMLQQRIDQTVPATHSIVSYQQSYPSPRDDFATEAWWSAMGAANANGFAGGAHQQRQTTLQAVLLSKEKAGKASRLVVVLESLSLTGCGDAFAIVKDPTSAMGAGIDQKVLQSHPRLDPGTVLVLDQVSYLKFGSVPYLCVTLANVLRVVPSRPAA